ncbi:phosphatidate cytidylyltransferase [Legionella oakridgensis]|nr:phosphatidate cytidylyltransferase [Legionella oakridgensis]ETO92519.1 CDP-diglyceride synthetase [Legionella oakridgensis RV-2-2007]KTD38706.1 phosphatidate cytidylyltransferase [Legionella oakridgensis]STY20891.1 phosphatidate cytidylyltransferase [Legionella longbeachae]
MFKQRLLTALVLVPLVLIAIYFASPWVLVLIILLAVMAGGWEWLLLMPVSRLLPKCIFILALVLMTWLSMYWLDYWLFAGLVVWILILLAVLTFPASQVFWGFPAVVGGACLLLLPLFASSLVAVFQFPQGKDLVVYLFCLIWAADIGAYLSGKSLGRIKLIPQVSPGKTIEGSVGGVLLAMLVAFIAYFYFRPSSVVSWFGIALGTVFISVLGDLFISILKRRCKLKDTGHIFPGHGGVLDRLDSLIAALPLFYCGMRFMPPGLH